MVERHWLQDLAEATHSSMTRAGLERSLRDLWPEAELGWSAPPPASADSIIELGDDEGGVGYLSIGNVELEPGERSLVARLVSLGQRTVRRFERVAHLSRTANEKINAARGPEPTVVARSPAMLDLVELVRAVAPHPTTVLVRGPSGSGKERVARLLHRWSERTGPFVAVNCGALPDELLESELFGHEAGAFTSAAKARRGRFELAHRGTLFLDEIGELSAAAQVRLLRVLEERAVTPLGAERSRPVDVRVVAATHRPLERWLEDGRFREDLYFRLTPFELEVPPLDERPEDLPDLARALVDEHARRLGRAAPRISAETLATLAGRPWPGNVRELSNLIERALVLDGGGWLKLPSQKRRRQARRKVKRFDDEVRSIIEAALDASGGKIHGHDGAAAALGLKPTTLQGKMQRLGIIRERRASSSLAR